MQENEETHSVILHAACEVLRVSGVNNLTLPAVAKQAGLSRSTVTYYYKNKQGLFESVRRHFYEKLKSVLTDSMSSLSQNDHFARALTTTVRSAYRFVREHRHIQRALLITAFQYGDDGEIYSPDWADKLVEMASLVFANRLSVSPTTARAKITIAVQTISRFATSVDQERERITPSGDLAEFENQVVQFVMDGIFGSVKQES